MQNREIRRFYLNALGIDEWIGRHSYRLQSTRYATKLLLIGAPFLANSMTEHCLIKALRAMNIDKDRSCYLYIADNNINDLEHHHIPYKKFRSELFTQSHDKAIIFLEANEKKVVEKSLDESSINVKHVRFLHFSIHQLLKSRNKKALYFALAQ